MLSGLSVTNMCPGAWVIAKGGFEAMTAACGVTPQAIVMNSQPSLAITHAPGKMLVTDIPDRDYLIP